MMRQNLTAVLGEGILIVAVMLDSWHNLPWNVLSSYGSYYGFSCGKIFTDEMGLCFISMSSKWTLYYWASPYDLWSVASSAGFKH